MRADVMTLEGVFCRGDVSVFEIPDFQRPFVWEEEVEELFFDLLDDFKGATKRRKSRFFLGTLLFAKQGNRCKIIDGQQRVTFIFTSLWIIMNTITAKQRRKNKGAPEKIRRILLNAEGKDRFRVVEEKDVDIYHKIKLGEEIIEGDNNLAKASNNIRSWVENINQENRLIKFVDYLLTNVEFAIIETEDYLRAWKLFIGLNAKGEPLLPADIIKAFICGEPQEKNHRTSEIWMGNMRPLKNRATNCLVDLTRYKTGKRVRDADLFKEFSALWRDRVITLQDISDSGNIYNCWWEKAYGELRKEYPGFKPPKKQSLKVLRRVDRRDFNPLIIALGLKYGKGLLFSSEEIEVLLKLIEAIEIRMAVCGKRNREREFAEISNWVDGCRKPEITQIIGQIKDKIVRPYVPKGDEFRRAICELTYKRKITGKLLITLEEGSRAFKVIDDFEIEHIMPVSPEDDNYWYKRAGVNHWYDYELIINNIGNLAPIDKKANIEARNGRWPAKKKAYEKLEGWELSRIPKKYPKWNNSSIEKRAKGIATKALKRWPL